MIEVKSFLFIQQEKIMFDLFTPPLYPIATTTTPYQHFSYYTTTVAIIIRLVNLSNSFSNFFSLGLDLERPRVVTLKWRYINSQDR